MTLSAVICSIKRNMSTSWIFLSGRWTSLSTRWTFLSTLWILLSTYRINKSTLWTFLFPDRRTRSATRGRLSSPMILRQRIVTGKSVRCSLSQHMLFFSPAHVRIPCKQEYILSIYCNHLFFSSTYDKKRLKRLVIFKGFSLPSDFIKYIFQFK